MPDVASGELTGGAAAGLSTGLGYRFDRDGVHFAKGILGDFQSVNFVSGSQGWILREDGSGEMNDITVNFGRVRGTLTADHIDADVRNWYALRTSSVNIPIGYDSRTQKGPDIRLGASGADYDMIFVSGSMGDEFIQTFIPASELSGGNKLVATIFWTTSRFLIGAKTHQLSFFVGLSGSTLTTSTYADDAGGSASVDQVWGVNSPS